MDSDSGKEARPPTPPRPQKHKGSFGSGQPTAPFVGDIPGATGSLDALSRASGRGVSALLDLVEQKTNAREWEGFDDVTVWL